MSKVSRKINDRCRALAKEVLSRRMLIGILHQCAVSGTDAIEEFVRVGVWKYTNHRFAYQSLLSKNSAAFLMTPDSSSAQYGSDDLASAAATIPLRSPSS